MKPYQLKRNLLYLAIQGKLVPQDSLEGNGSDILKDNHDRRIRMPSELQKRIGKGCKPIKEEDYLFEIPDNWKWERFGNLVVNYDSQRKPVTKSDRKTSQGIYDYYGATGAIDRVDEFIFEGEYLMIGEDGGNFFVDRDNAFIASGRFWANNHVHVVQPIVCNISYLKTCLDAYNLPNMGLINGIAVPKLNQENLNSIMIPVPPLSEQQRIVAKIEELMPLVEEYGKAEERLTTLNADFPDKLRKSILQQAIQGKLTERDLADEPASELLKRIHAEKERLIKEGKIKKEKPLPPITEEEMPFEIPDGWVWVKLNEICSHIADIDHNMPKSVSAEEGVLFLSAKDLLDNGTINYTKNVKYISRDDFERLSRKALPQIGDIIYSRIGAALGKARLVKENIEFLVSYSCCIIRPLLITAAFLTLYLESPLILEHSKNARQSIGVPDLGMGEIKNYIVALPPLAEQQRIVDRVNKLLAVCDELK